MSDPRPTMILRECWRTIQAVLARYTGSDRTSEPAPTSDNAEQFLPPATKWLRDHYRFIEHQIAETREAIPDRSYRALRRNNKCPGDRLPFIHAVARSLVRQMVETCIRTGGS